MDHAAVLALYDRDMREGARPESPDARVERTGNVVRHVGGDGGWNGVVWSDLDDAGVDAAVAEQVAFFTGLGREFEWKLHGHDRPGDLAQRLGSAGFTSEPEETLLIAETGEQLGDVRPPDGVRVVPVTDRAGVELMVEAHEKAFGRDGSRLRDLLLARLATAPDTLVAVVALAGETPVSSARMELIEGAAFAGLWGGGTVDGWRGRGVYRALIAHRARIAADRGYRYLQVDASDQSRPILERLGFMALTTTTPYVYAP
ncbi:GNAT family N-acetyltransferase [Streptomyces sp. ID05-04B]|uniref:GNAT family N-acetyltransferase n=1 Tax=unclassified Streptomyces TaxID=2593676 RepID=UPI000D1B276D|nr:MULTISPECIES: GNAT family N-acetyltransferase [unclassified Streptomyces]AVV46864.1 GNAT family N-acetyltransferase [Streptomyces sp. P3]MDX5563835.1 GNAT family N-acetyltransferase [Streptomyces sp. ID05-04B]